MNNKISKRRLSNFLAYEWILIIVVAIASIVVWELIFSFSSVRLNSGQVFEYYYDANVSSSNDEAFRSMLKREETFSFDVLDVYATDNTKDMAVLSNRQVTHELKAIFSDLYTSSKEGEYQSYSANKIIDVYSMYTYEDEKGGIIYSAKEYLSKFLKEQGKDPLVFENLSKDKIKENFIERLGKDNRYRAGEISEENEYERIEKLCAETRFLEKVIKFDSAQSEENSIFYKYTKYEDAKNTFTLIQVPENENEKEWRYGLNLSKLTGGEMDTAQFFRLIDSKKKGDIVLLMFNYGIYHEDMQFETISFVNTIIRQFASPTILQGIQNQI